MVRTTTATIGGRIRAARRQRGVTQLKLGQAIGYTESQIGKFETGQATPSIAVLEAIARALRVSPAKLAGWEVWIV